MKTDQADDRRWSAGASASDVMPRIVHITSREGLGSPFLPQVARPMALLKTRGLDVELVVFAPVGELLRPKLRALWRERRREVAEVYGLPLVLLPSAPNRLRGLWRDSLLLGLWLSRRRSVPTILHCRGTLATQTALATRRSQPGLAVVSDCRGIEAPEYLMYQGLKRLEDASPEVQRQYEAREQRQRRVIEQADRVLCVSDAMRRELAARWSIASELMRTVACCTDTQAGRKAAAGRDAVRARLGLSDKLVISYSGSAAPWQVVPQMLATFRQIADLRPDAYLLVLTSDVGKLHAAISAAEIPASCVTVKSVPHREVPAHLAAADVGLLLREENVVNRVASPMKFAEYIACGVPVVMTDQIGDFSDMVRRDEIGCVLPMLGLHTENLAPLQRLLAALRNGASEMRCRCIDAAERNLAWNAALDAISVTYEVVARTRWGREGWRSATSAPH